MQTTCIKQPLPSPTEALHMTQLISEWRTFTDSKQSVNNERYNLQALAFGTTVSEGELGSPRPA